MDIYNSGLILVCAALVLLLIVLIFIAVVEVNDTIVSVMFGTSIFLLIIGFTIVIVGCFINTFSNKFEVVATAPLRAKDDNIIYYIDPKTEEEVEVKMKKDTKIYPTTKPSYVEFSQTTWLCFTIDKQTYYITIEES